MSGVLELYGVCGIVEEKKLLSEEELKINELNSMSPISSIVLVKDSLGEVIPPGFEVVCSSPTTILQKYDCVAHLDSELVDDGKLLICYSRRKCATSIYSIQFCEVDPEGMIMADEDATAISHTVEGRPAVFIVENKKYCLCVKSGQDSTIGKSIYWMGAVNHDAPREAYELLLNGLNLFISYVKCHEIVLNHKPQIIDHFPKNNIPDMIPLLPLFSNPRGSVAYTFPFGISFSSVVLTNQIGTRFHVIILTYTEPVSLELENFPKYLFIAKSMFLVSKSPFYSNFMLLLLDLYGLLDTDSPVPFERYILNLFEIPMVPSGYIRIEHHVKDTKISFFRPERESMPLEKFPVDILFEHFSLKNSLTLLMLVLFEYKIIFHSKMEGCLNAIMENLCDLIYPFSWQHMFISVVPETLLDVIHAPLPFLVGMLSSTFESLQNSISIDDFVVVNIDNNYIGPHETMPKLPAIVKLEQQLEQQLRAFNELQSDKWVNIQQSKRPLPPPKLSARREIRRVLLQYFVDILAHYQDCVVFPKIEKPNSGSLIKFNIPKFLSNINEANHLFYRKFFSTQMFMKFIEDKSIDDSGLNFFDLAIEMKNTKYNLIKRSHRKRASQQIVKTVQSPSVSSNGLLSNSFKIAFGQRMNPTYFYPLNKEVILTTLSESEETENNRQSLIRKTSQDKFFYGGTSGIQEGSNEFLTGIYTCWLLLYRAFLSVSPKINPHSISLVKDTVHKLRSADAIIGISVFEILFDICSILGDKGFAHELIAIMKSENIQASPRISGTLMDIFSEFGRSTMLSTTLPLLFSDEYDMTDGSIRLIAVCSACESFFDEIYILFVWLQDDSPRAEISCHCGHKIHPLIEYTDSDDISAKFPLLKPTSIEVELEIQLDSRSQTGTSIVQESKESLSQKHPILFWNLVWYFSNVSLPFLDLQSSLKTVPYEGEFVIQVNGLDRFLQGWPAKKTLFDTEESIKIYNICYDLYMENPTHEGILEILIDCYFKNHQGVTQEIGCYETIARIIGPSFESEAEFFTAFSKTANNTKWKANIKDKHSSNRAFITIRNTLTYLSFI